MKVPKVTSILLVVLLSLSFLNFILKYYTYFVLIVSSSKKLTSDANAIAQETGDIPHPHELFVPLLTFIPTKSPVITRPWVILTSSFIEENFIGLTMSFMLLFYLGKYLENMWGSREYSKFILINVVVTNVSIYLYYTINSMIFHFDTTPPVVISAMGINMGLFVAIKQRISNHYFLFFKGNLRIRVSYLPFLLLVACFSLQLLSDDFKISFILSLMDFIISWTYLRFFKIGTNERESYLLPFALNRKKSNKSKFKFTPVSNTSNKTNAIDNRTSSLHLDSVPLRGDRSEQFSFYTFFPAPLSLLMKVPTTLIFNIFTHYEILNEKDFPEYEEDDTDKLMFEDIDNLQSNLFGLSSLKGAQDVSPIRNAGSKLKTVWDWLVSNQKTKVGIKNSMDKRRKLALKELE
ncbi:uncharacterized protein AC631_01419 [Debaryomyces fabryi]|uniref:DUF1751-domain-containing protein n=1 Tax=Debaryomyces fabryi TaxID=58627 RepID=A0A0V1Q376_9ASCO|nr:uncharacterized protein AC631_01419 [Debaryomyces fabryi]KSA02822.1 hypothetical protein AC631_01419 [Debaryomyces fabryi]CUM46116.1 unnamed protein product [Debaryomyces fabryi]